MWIEISDVSASGSTGSEMLCWAQQRKLGSGSSGDWPGRIRWRFCSWWEHRVTSSPVSRSSQLHGPRGRHLAPPYCKAKTLEAVILLYTAGPLTQNMYLLHHNFSGTTHVLWIHSTDQVCSLFLLSLQKALISPKCLGLWSKPCPVLQDS